MTIMTPVETPEEVGLSSERLARIPDYFQAYLDRKKVSGMSFLIARGGRIAYQHCMGVQDFDTNSPIKPDTIFRIYSMSKPITSVALMMLYEEGKFRLDHEVSRYIPEFAQLKVYDQGGIDDFTTKPLERPMIVRDLLTHTSGLTYGFMFQNTVDRLYRKGPISDARSSKMTLEEYCIELAKMPLVFSPGTSWNYSVSTDVCGRLVEVMSGMSLDEFFKKRIFEPLNMTDTSFDIPADKVDRFASCYARDPKTKEAQLQDSGSNSSYFGEKSFFSGGGGLISTIGDYYKFCQMLLNGGELDGKRLLSPTTIDFMTTNHLPENKTMSDMGDSLFSENRMDGSGFGLGFSVILNPVEVMAVGSTGSYSWGGAASTYFWIDPSEDLLAIFMTQLMPSDAYPMRAQLQQLTYAAIEN
ncbi:MAG: CubicO group peptidase (beta-lactamase class C family) [Gammaproteobacteria bacterium]|jgi:CubicO group peptidase (beta-lactamase class C family)